MVLELDLRSTEDGSRQKYTNRTITFSPTGEWQRITQKYDIKDNIFTIGTGTVNFETCYIRPILYKMNTTHAAIQVKELQIETGTKPTDWTPASEDIIEEIVGESYDEFDEAPASEIIKIDDNTFDFFKKKQGKLPITY